MEGRFNNNFQVPGKFYPLELDLGETQETKLSAKDSKSNLPLPVKDLITLIFDIGKTNLLSILSIPT